MPCTSNIYKFIYTYNILLHVLALDNLLLLFGAHPYLSPYLQAIPTLHGRSDGQLCCGFVFNSGSLVWLSDVVELPEGSYTSHPLHP